MFVSVFVRFRGRFARPSPGLPAGDYSPFVPIINSVSSGVPTIPASPGLPIILSRNWTCLGTCLTSNHVLSIMHSLHFFFFFLARVITYFLRCRQNNGLFRIRNQSFYDFQKYDIQVIHFQTILSGMAGNLHTFFIHDGKIRTKKIGIRKEQNGALITTSSCIP